MTTSKDIKNELVDDLEATEEEAETVKGGSAKFVASAKSLASAKSAKSAKFLKA